MSVGKNIVKMLIVLSAGSFTLPARAALVDNFESYITGTVGGGATSGVWAAVGTDTGTIQNEAGNLVLSISAPATNSGVYRALPTPIPGSTAATTAFMRLRANDPLVNASIGLSDVAAPVDANNFGVFEPQLRMISDLGGVNTRFNVRDGAAFTDLTVPTSITIGQWYNVWMVANTATDTWNIYINTGTANATAGDLKMSNIGFRDAVDANTALTTFLFYGPAGGTLAATIDDINISPGLDLTNHASVACMLGDTNCNGTVELADFNPIRDNFQKMVAMRNQGDLNRDGIVEFADFREWKNAFLGGGGSLEGVDLSFAGVVPEPTSACLVSFAAVIFGFVGSRRRGDR